MDFLMELLLGDFLGKPVWLWVSFIGIVLALLAFDLGIMHRDNHEIGVRESLGLSAGYIGMGLAFGAWVWWYLGSQSGMEYLTRHLQQIADHLGIEIRHGKAVDHGVAIGQHTHQPLVVLAGQDPLHHRCLEEHGRGGLSTGQAVVF